MSGMDLDTFLGHTTRESSGGALEWRKNSPPEVTTWFARRAKIWALWRHGFKKLVEYDKEGQTYQQTFFENLVCWEDERTLRSRKYREDDDSRSVPPVRCPMCRLVEHVRARVTGPEADLEHWTPLFTFHERDDKEPFTFYAGGFAGLWQGDDAVGDELKARLEKIGIYFARPPKGNSFKQDASVGVKYLMLVVDHARPDLGVQKAVESESLGNAVKGVIAAAKEALGDKDLGNPIKNPYAIRWKYFAEKSFDKKYGALRMEKLAMTPEVEEAINADPPDIRDEVDFFDGALLRTMLEARCQVQGVPWDEIFSAEQPANPDCSPSPRAVARAAPTAPEGVQQMFARGALALASAPAAPVAPARPRLPPAQPRPAAPAAPPVQAPPPAQAAPAALSADDPDAWQCELMDQATGRECGGLYKGDIPCTVCGTQYDADGKPLPKPAPAARQPRKRSEVVRPLATTEALAAMPSVAAPPPPPARQLPRPAAPSPPLVEAEELDEDQIPFD